VRSISAAQAPVNRPAGPAPAARHATAALAYECGFSDLSHFYRRFRERFGMAPGRARRHG